MKPAVAVVIALIAGFVLGVVVTRIGASPQDGVAELVRDPRAWLVFSAALALTTRGPVVGALAGLTAMVGLLAALQVLPWNSDAADVGGLAADNARALRRLFEDGDWLDGPMLAASAIAGAAIGTVRLVLRTGRRVALIAAAIVVLIVVVAGTPAISDLPSDAPDQMRTP